MCLIIGLAAVAIPIMANAGRNTSTAISKLQADPAKHAANDHGIAIAALGKGLVHPQDYYDRRREYWEKRLERDLDDSDEHGDDDSADKEDSKADKDEAKDDDSTDKEEDSIERRREYWRERLDKEW
jgi:hypothetical protein